MNPVPVGQPVTTRQVAKPAAGRRKATQALDIQSMYDIETADLANLLKSCDRLQWNHQILASLNPEDFVETRPKRVGVHVEIIWTPIITPLKS